MSEGGAPQESARAKRARIKAEREAAIAEGESAPVPDAPVGAPVDPTPTTAPLLIVDALSKAPALAIHRVSLNFAMFPSTFERGERLGAGPVLKTWRRLLITGNTWFQLESLYKFSAKFQPVWYPRFLIYPRVGHSVRGSIAAGQAESFIVFPRLTLPFGRRR